GPRVTELPASPPHPGTTLLGYPGGSTPFDEMLLPDGSLRPSWRGVGEVLGELGPTGLTERSRAIARLLEDDGVTYRAHGARAEQAWKLDP
ncbi:hypothetical protein, partial [Pseudomonas sp. GP01-A5]|uniref:hypothetical protein n=1 Tax=Pseudomonas sp. GP01-A5 TaxID=2070563 RepID=UPI000CB31592